MLTTGKAWGSGGRAGVDVMTPARMPARLPTEPPTALPTAPPIAALPIAAPPSSGMATPSHRTLSGRIVSGVFNHVGALPSADSPHLSTATSHSRSHTTTTRRVWNLMANPPSRDTVGFTLHGRLVPDFDTWEVHDQFLLRLQGVEVGIGAAHERPQNLTIEAPTHISAKRENRQ